ncbi:hypothetical protein GCM10023205_45060 [Yinghuangia aomiensis]|uniref:Uncharacterized protein n=1 Tax=Yinghuangia aomiensis TaxID=676205 RepID=A0ABP9HLM4_9ACTN
MVGDQDPFVAEPFGGAGEGRVLLGGQADEGDPELHAADLRDTSADAPRIGQPDHAYRRTHQGAMAVGSVRMLDSPQNDIARITARSLAFRHFGRANMRSPRRPQSIPTVTGKTDEPGKGAYP